jgi:hypothetical protein
MIISDFFISAFLAHTVEYLIIAVFHTKFLTQVRTILEAIYISIGNQCCGAGAGAGGAATFC